VNDPPAPRLRELVRSSNWLTQIGLPTGTPFKLDPVWDLPALSLTKETNLRLWPQYQVALAPFPARLGKDRLVFVESVPTSKKHDSSLAEAGPVRAHHPQPKICPVLFHWLITLFLEDAKVFQRCLALPLLPPPWLWLPGSEIGTLRRRLKRLDPSERAMSIAFVLFVVVVAACKISGWLSCCPCCLACTSALVCGVLRRFAAWFQSNACKLLPRIVPNPFERETPLRAASPANIALCSSRRRRRPSAAER